MGDKLLNEVRERVLRILHDEAEDPGCGRPPIERISDVVEVALVLARREGYVQGSLHKTQDDTFTFREMLDSVAAPQAYPLPMRTRQVLREEPVPGTDSPLCRVNASCLERRYIYRDAEWHPGPVGCGDFALMAHALDLHANPYRTEVVPAYESDPWGRVWETSVSTAERWREPTYRRPLAQLSAATLCTYTVVTLSTTRTIASGFAERTLMKTRQSLRLCTRGNGVPLSFALLDNRVGTSLETSSVCSVLTILNR